MKKLTVQTPTGKDVNIRYNGTYRVEVPAARIDVEHKNLVVMDAVYVPPLGDKYPALLINDKSIALAREAYEIVNKLMQDIDREKLADLNKQIPGYSDLVRAYKHRSEQLGISRRYMERAMDTSIGSGDSGDVEGAENRVKDLESKYPVAVQYIKWISRDSSTTSGYQAHRAAEALASGASIEDATQIANDYDQWI